jgi:CRP-like cAMP-binding protein
MVRGEFIEYLNEITPLDEEDLIAIKSLLIYRKVKKKEYLSFEYQIGPQCFFVLNGCLRSVVYNEDGTEVTINFFFENQWCRPIQRSQSEPYCMYKIQAIEDCELVYFTKVEMDKIYSNLKEGNKLGRIIFEQQCEYYLSRMCLNRTTTIEKRYKLLGEWFPGIYNRIPQHLIASYLGISRVHLSRIKNLMK